MTPTCGESGPSSGPKRRPDTNGISISFANYKAVFQNDDFLRSLLNSAIVATVVTFLALVIGSFGMVAGGRVPFTFIGTNDAETINVQLKMPVGTPIEETDEIVSLRFSSLPRSITIIEPIRGMSKARSSFDVMMMVSSMMCFSL